jgi:hypothetical protein
MGAAPRDRFKGPTLLSLAAVARVSDTCGRQFSAVFPVFVYAAKRMPEMHEHPEKHGIS